MKNNIKEICRAHRLLKCLVKYGITALTVLCTIHCIALTFGYDFFGVHITLCAFLFVLGLCLSQLFSLCWIHKVCVVYTCSVVLCVVFKRQQMFHVLSIDLDFARFIMAALGVTILQCVVWKIRRRSY